MTGTNHNPHYVGLHIMLCRIKNKGTTKQVLRLSQVSHSIRQAPEVYVGNVEHVGRSNVRLIFPGKYKPNPNTRANCNTNSTPNTKPNLNPNPNTNPNMNPNPSTNPDTDGIVRDIKCSECQPSKTVDLLQIDH